MNRENDIVVVAAKRTPLGGFQGSLSSITAPQLGALVLNDLVTTTQVDINKLNEVLMGCVLPAGLKQAPARQVLLGANLPESVSATTLNKVCGSGMKAVMMARDTIAAGSANLVIAGGMESMSRAPYLMQQARTGFRMGHNQVLDHMFLDGLEDAYTGASMGSFAQQTADDYQMSREQMDEYALSSLEKANVAIAAGAFRSEIVPVTVSTKTTDIVVDTDEQPANAKPDKIPKLKPAFTKDGTITAANSSSISDGAAALMLTTRKIAKDMGLTSLASLRAQTSHAQAPATFTTAPIGAINKLLQKLSWSVNEVDLFEINEAFAMVAMLAINELRLDREKVNVNGGACALGHPIGCTGARILVTLIHALRNRGLKRGIASLCIGGGEATAVAVEIDD